MRWCMVGVCVTLLAVAVLERSRQFTPPEDWPVAAYLPDGPRNLWDAGHWRQRRAAIREATASSIAAVRFPGSLATQIGGAPIDGYPQELTVLFANRVNWSPRPVPQSYSAYSPELDGLNARHYRTTYGPELILYQLDAIDGQHPWFVDPLTLREVFGRYEVGLRLPPFLLLKRRSEPVAGEPDPVARAKVRIGVRVPVPQDGGALLAAGLDFRLTPVGQLKDKLWKVHPPSLVVEFADGSTQTFRVVWRNAVNGLLISELPANLGEIAALWEPSARTRVVAFTVQANSADFNEEIDLTWLRTAIPSQVHK